MANNGWAKLGEALAGTSPAQRADIEAKTIQALAGRDRAMAGARMDIEKARALDGLGSYLTQMGIENGDAVAGTQRAGVNLNTLYGGLAKQQNMGFRQAARDAAVAGDQQLAVSEQFGLANAPVKIADIDGGMVLNPYKEGGGSMSVTPVGQSQIGANNARAQASLITANRPRASGSGSGSPKMGEIQKMRMQAELAPISEGIKQLSEVVMRNAAGMRGATPSVRVQAENQLRELQAAQAAVFEKYEGASSGGVADAILPPASTAEQPFEDDEVAVVEPVLSGPTWMQDPNTGVQRIADQPRSARIEQGNGKPVVSVGTASEAKAAWAKLAKGAGLKFPNGTIRWKD